MPPLRNKPPLHGLIGVLVAALIAYGSIKIDAHMGLDSKEPTANATRVETQR